MLVNLDPKTKNSLTHGPVLQGSGAVTTVSDKRSEDPANTLSQLAVQAVAKQSAESVGTKEDLLAAEKLAPEKKDAAIEARKDQSTFGSRLHWMVQHPGLDWIVNSTLSLIITFNLLPTKVGQSMINGMGYLMKPFSYVKSAVTGAHVNEADMKKLALSNGEVGLMLIAGTMVVPPMKWMDDAKDHFVAKANIWWDKLKGKEPNPIDKEIASSEHTEKKPWGKWLKARAAGVGGILLVNSAIETYNNKNPNNDLYQVAYGWGAKIHDRFPRVSKFISSIVANDQFFTPAKKDELIQKIQTKTNIVKHFESPNGFQREKAIFAEQFRLVWKELALTFVMMGMIAGFSVLFGKEKNDKKEAKENTPAIKNPTTMDDATAPETSEKQHHFVNQVTSKAPKQEALMRPQQGFEKHLDAQRDMQTAAGLQV